MVTARSLLSRAPRAHPATDQSGFSLVELLVALVVISVLLVVVVPSYIGYKKRAEKQASNASVRAAVSAAHAYYADNKRFTGMTAAILKSSYDRGIKTSGSGSLTVTAATATAYTLRSRAGSCTATLTGPAGTVSNSC